MIFIFALLFSGIENGQAQAPTPSSGNPEVGLPEAPVAANQKPMPGGFTQNFKQYVIPDPPPDVPRETLLSLRDPFRLPSLEYKEERILHPLEMVPISKLKLIGVVTGPKKMRGMILTPDGKTHFVGLKDRLGDRQGIVSRLGPHGILITEKISNMLGVEENIITEIKVGGEPEAISQGKGE